jgi:hypothetical protein
MERRERASIARSGGAELHGHAAGFLNKASGRAVSTDMMSTKARRGVAVAGGLAAILAAAWFRSADPTKAPTAGPTASQPQTGDTQTPSLTLWPETPTHFKYDRFAWRALLPVPVVPAAPEPLADSERAESVVLDGLPAAHAAPRRISSPAMVACPRDRRRVRRSGGSTSRRWRSMRRRRLWSGRSRPMG